MRGSIRLSVVFVLGAILGVWSFIEPWVIDYGFGGQHQWSPSTWSNVWIGAVVTAASLMATEGLRGRRSCPGESVVAAASLMGR